MQQEMKKFILLSLLAICYNILPALAQYEYSPQCKMNFGKGEVYSIEVGGNEKENNDTILGNSVAIILRMENSSSILVTIRSCSDRGGRGNLISSIILLATLC